MLARRRRPSTRAPRTDGSRACRWRTSAACSCSSGICCSARRSRFRTPRSPARHRRRAPRRALHIDGADAAHPPARRRRRPRAASARSSSAGRAWMRRCAHRAAAAGVRDRADLRDDRDVRRRRLRGTAAGRRRGACVAVGRAAGPRTDADARVPARPGSDRWPHSSAGGWLRTGDGGEVDADGTVRVLGRLADVIVSGGEKIWPAEVEAALVEPSRGRGGAGVGKRRSRVGPARRRPCRAAQPRGAADARSRCATTPQRPSPATSCRAS